MANEANDNDLLLPFETLAISGDYREYYKTKRNNFFATIQQKGDLWRYHLQLDEIWLRDIADLRVAIDQTRSFPMLFFITAHAKIRISIELAFSACIQEARSIMRDAVESTAFGHYMLRKPELQEVWLRKDDPEGRTVFAQRFEKDKKLQLFAGLDELYRTYGQLSEIGSPVNPLSLSTRIKVVKDDDRTRSFNISYTDPDIDEKTVVTGLFSLLLTCFTIENTFSMITNIVWD